jgi:hypothetical protein
VRTEVRSGPFQSLPAACQGEPADWSGLEVTGTDNLVDGRWTSVILSFETTSEARPLREAMRSRVHDAHDTPYEIGRGNWATDTSRSR